MGIEGYHNYTTGLRLRTKIYESELREEGRKLRRSLPFNHCRGTHQMSQRVVRHISRGIAESVSATVTENHRRPRRRHGVQHRRHRDVREVHHHPKSIHLQHDTLKTPVERR